MSDLPVIGAVTHSWTMGSNLSSFAEFRELTGNPLAGALAIRAKQIGEPGPDSVTAEDSHGPLHGSATRECERDQFCCDAIYTIGSEAASSQSSSSTLYCTVILALLKKQAVAPVIGSGPLP